MSARSVWYQNLPPLDLTGQAGALSICEKKFLPRPHILPVSPLYSMRAPKGAPWDWAERPYTEESGGKADEKSWDAVPL